MLSSVEMIAALRGEDVECVSALDAYAETQAIFVASLAAMGVQTAPTLSVASSAEIPVSTPSFAHPNDYSIRVAI
jgi:hypothetical protein